MKILNPQDSSLECLISYVYLPMEGLFFSVLWIKTGIMHTKQTFYH
jgi:hypothetical protein